MNILISLLGAGDYKATTYHLHAPAADPSYQTSFTVRALAEHLKPDQLLILGTTSSWKKNEPALRQELAPLGIPLDLLTWPESFAPADLRQAHGLLREKLLNYAPPGHPAELHLDLTLGFRFQPMLALLSLRITCSLAQRLDEDLLTLQGPTLRSAWYGELQADQSVLHDLSELMQTTDWLSALEQWQRTGAAGALEHCAGNDPSAAPRHALTQLVLQSEALFLNDLGSIKTAETDYCKAVRKTPFAGYLHGLEQLVADQWQLRDGSPQDWSPSRSENYPFLLGRARRHLHQGRTLQACVLLRELCARAFAARLHELGLHDQKLAEVREQAFGYLGKLASQPGQPPRKPWLHFLPPLLGSLGPWPALANKITTLRNRLTHCKEESTPRKTLTQSLAALIEQAADALAFLQTWRPTPQLMSLKPEPPQAAPTQAAPAKVAMEQAVFWNLSNHPLTSWQPSQQSAARRWNRADQQADLQLRDLPFPNVDPLADEESVERLAGEQWQRLQHEGARKGEPVLVQGEFTLTHALVQILQRKGLIPLTATTQRCSSEHQGADGRIERRQWFDFQQFRCYPRMNP